MHTLPFIFFHNEPYLLFNTHLELTQQGRDHMDTQTEGMSFSKKIASGIGIFLVGLIIIYWIFANTIIKHIAEAEIGKAHGAEANIASVDHSLFPITITIDGIELTDAHNPTRNQVQVGQVKADVAFIPLLSQKIILDNVLIDNVAFGQLRREKGEVFRLPGQSFQDILDVLPSKEEIPTKDELLARSALQTPAAVASAKTLKTQYIEPLRVQAKNLPTKADIDAYQAQFDALKKTDYNDPAALLNAKVQWDEIKTKMRADKVKIAEFKALASEANTALKTQLAALKTAPKADYELVKGAITGDSDALSQLTQMVFGAKAQQFNQSLLAITNTIAPMLAPKPDTPITPVDPNAPYPNLLVKQAEVNVLVGSEKISSQWANITNQHIITKTPTTFKVDATNGALWENLAMTGSFEILADGVNAKQAWDIAGLVLDNVSVSDDPRLQALIETAALFSKGNVSMEKNRLSGGANFLFNQLKLDATGNDEYTQIIAQTLSTLDKLNVTSTYSGDINAPTFQLKSDLDNQLGSALMDGILADQAGPLAELRQHLEAQAAEGLGVTQGEMAEVTQLLQLANGDMSSLNSLLEGQLGGTDQLKDKLMNKLKGKLFGD